MAVNLIDSNDIQVAQTGNNIELQIDSDIKNAVTQNTSDIATAQQDITNLENGNVYSTNEVNTGKVWIDGKIIYRKVINTTSPSTASTSAAPILTLTGINIETIVKLEGNINYANITWRDINAYQTSSLFSFVDVYYEANSNSWKIRQCVTGESYLSKQEYIILEYTKTN